MPAPAEQRDVGGSGPPPVLLVHGQPGSGAGWRKLSAFLEDDFLVLAPDRPGWGANEQAATSLSGNAEYLGRLLDEAVPDGRAPVVVGHSLGGGIALELALARPGGIAALVLVGSVGVQAAVGQMDRLLAVPVIGDGVLRAGVAVLRTAADGAARMARSRRTAAMVSRTGREGAIRLLMADGHDVLAGRNRVSFLSEQRALLEETPAIERRLGELVLPCAVVHGAGDHIVPAAAAGGLAAAIPGAELVFVPHAGHLLPVEQPALLAAIVRRYARLGTPRNLAG